MASVFGHVVASTGLGCLFPSRIARAKFFIIGALCSVIPDLDVIGFKYGIPYESMFGHRGITHSISFSVMLAILVTFIFFKSYNKSNQLLIGLYLFISTVSHGVLDAMTTGGRGVAFFAPFSDERIFLPWRFIQVSPIGISSFFSEWGMAVILSESIFIGLPVLLIVGLSLGIKKLRSRD